MKILILASLNSHAGKMAPFIAEQAEALQAAGCEVVYFGVKGKGILGYLKQLPKLRCLIREQHIDLVHAHYGLCCLLANLQRLVPVVSTYHGSDINSPKVRRFSKVAMRLSAWNIFVSKRTQDSCRHIIQNRTRDSRKDYKYVNICVFKNILRCVHQR